MGISRLRNFPLVTDHWSLVTEVTFPYRSAVFTLCNLGSGRLLKALDGTLFPYRSAVFTVCNKGSGTDPRQSRDPCVSIPLGSLHSLQLLRPSSISQFPMWTCFHTARQSSQSATGRAVEGMERFFRGFHTAQQSSQSATLRLLTARRGWS